jgi:hypothetical protein
LRGVTKNSSFLRCRAVFLSNCPLFWGSMEIYKEYDSPYIFERHDQKLIVFCILWPFSWAIAHSFGVLEWFTMSMTLSTCLWGMTKNSSFWHFRAVFVSYFPLFWGSGVIYKVHDTKYMFVRHDQKLAIFCVFGPFLWAIAHCFGVPEWFKGPWHSVHVWEAWPKNHRFCVLRPFSWAIAHSFGVP